MKREGSSLKMSFDWPSWIQAISTIILTVITIIYVFLNYHLLNEMKKQTEMQIDPSLNIKIDTKTFVIDNRSPLDLKTVEVDIYIIKKVGKEIIENNVYPGVIKVNYLRRKSNIKIELQDKVKSGIVYIIKNFETNKRYEFRGSGTILSVIRFERVVDAKEFIYYYDLSYGFYEMFQQLGFIEPVQKITPEQFSNTIKQSFFTGYSNATNQEPNINSSQ